jgi:hypothetical protein
MTTPGERIVRVEVQVGELSKAFEEHKKYTHDEFEEVKKKLDEVIALRNKGAGIFWFIALFSLESQDLFYKFLLGLEDID